jgi:hypothetical protein
LTPPPAHWKTEGVGGTARHDEETNRKKVWERRLVDAFLRDFGSDGAG